MCVCAYTRTKKLACLPVVRARHVHQNDIKFPDGEIIIHSENVKCVYVMK